MTHKSQHPLSWSGQKVTVLGLSRSGIAVAKYIQSRGGDVLLSETIPASEENAPQRRALEAMGVTIEMGSHSPTCLMHAPLAVISPGIPPSNPFLLQLRNAGVEIISEVEFAARENRKNRQAPLIGITGTNGKTTTTTLISRILTHSGLKAPVCGNIGIPMTQIVDENDFDVLVAELSSFQLEFSDTLRAKIAVFMNFTPDHLDWHGSLEAYEHAKLKLFTGSQSPEWSVCLANDPVTEKIRAGTRGKIFGFSLTKPPASFNAGIYMDNSGVIWMYHLGQAPEPFFNVRDLQIIGRHNFENVMAAIAVASLMDIPKARIIEACLSFPGVEHRLEKTAVIPKAGFPVLYYNDSKATNVDAALSAIRAFDQEKVILIAGGRDKKTALDSLVAEVKARVKHTILIGEARERFSQAFRQAGISAVSFQDSLEAAIAEAYRLSEGEAVLFSPACSSFDMFLNFEVRGTRFKEAVLAFQASLSNPGPVMASGTMTIPNRSP